MEYLNKVDKAISILQELQPLVREVVIEQQEQGVFDPSVSVDDDFESVIDMLNKLHENIKLTM